jgi:hypothetical protein
MTMTNPASAAARLGRSGLVEARVKAVKLNVAQSSILPPLAMTNEGATNPQPAFSASSAMT